MSLLVVQGDNHAVSLLVVQGDERNQTGNQVSGLTEQKWVEPLCQRFCWVTVVLLLEHTDHVGRGGRVGVYMLDGVGVWVSTRWKGWACGRLHVGRGWCLCVYTLEGVGVWVFTRWKSWACGCPHVRRGGRVCVYTLEEVGVWVSTLCLLLFKHTDHVGRGGHVGAYTLEEVGVRVSTSWKGWACVYPHLAYCFTN